VVGVREAFTTKGFGDHSIVFASDYHPLSTTLAAHHFSTVKEKKEKGKQPEKIDEKVLWSYGIQLVNGLRAVHKEGLSIRGGLRPESILLTSKNRIRINHLSIPSVLSPSPTNTQEDIQDLGRLLLSLSCVSLLGSSTGASLTKMLEHLSKLHERLEKSGGVVFTAA